MSGNSTFFDSTQTPSAPMPTYNAMLSRGWKVIAPANYLLPQATGGVNPCNSSETPSPTISNVNVNSITNNSAVVTWDTDQPANSRIYFNTGSGAYAVGPFDTNLVQSLSITLTGLSGFTFFNVYVSSTNNQNKTSDTASSPLSFRTLR